MAKKYYNISRLLKTDAQYNILLGQRANGKSYQVKKYCLEHAYKHIAVERGKFVYLRRWREDIKTNNVESYFNDMDIIKITKGEYSLVTAYHGYIYFANIDEKSNKIIKGALIGRFCALNEAERYKSNVFNGYENIIYEEFITNNIYLNNEPDTLQHFVSTVFRERNGRVFLVGNTISRVCPYFNEWSLENVLKQKQGDIDVYNFHTANGGMVTIAVEYCADSQGENKMFFGRSEKNIVSGIWDSKEMPKLPLPQDCYQKLYEIKVDYNDFHFLLELLFDEMSGDFCVFVYPFTGHRYVERVLSNIPNGNPNTTYCLKDNKAENLINRCFLYGKVFYSDNLTGADFETVNKYFKIGLFRGLVS